MNGTVAASGLPTLPADGDIHLWWLDLPSCPDDITLLSPLEQARAQRFAFARDRRRFVAAHGALRVILAAYLGADAGALDFVTGTSGKPALAAHAPGDQGLAFNLSHSGDHAALVVARSGDIGVDIELARTGRQRRMMLDMLSPQECAQAALLDDAALTAAFPVAWTRKEACVKAIGIGLTGTPRDIDVGLDGDSRTVAMTALAEHPTVHVITLRSPAGVPTSVARAGVPIGAVQIFRFPEGLVPPAPPEAAR